jgi:hypothetical protein
LVAHFLVAVSLVTLSALAQKWLLVEGDPHLFDVCPVRYIFDAIDVIMLALFMVFGTLEAIEAFKVRHG